VSPLVRRFCLAAFLATFAPGFAAAQPAEPVFSLAKKEKRAFLDTLKELVSIETGSRDLEGLDRAADLIAARLRALGAKVELVDPTADAYRMERTTTASSGRSASASRTSSSPTRRSR
jgi:glutamate carboxypeptidase